ncbi:MAG: hypothetical protein HQM10_19595 [Candidatus Riflebacteria bacterium]|nr:hypothetical protein [Candidatus Riflebacteria bacterium]
MPLKPSFKSKFKKQLAKLDKADQIIINSEMNRFIDGEKVDVRRLDGKQWRLKINDWRVFFFYEDDLIIFSEVKRRSSKTY